MYPKSVRVLMTLGAAVLIGSFGSSLAVRPVLSGVALQPLYLDLVEVPFQPGASPQGPVSIQAFNVPVPPNGSAWHELAPVFNATHGQQAYVDGGDGLITSGDFIRLDGIDYEITWAGPTYFATIAGTQYAWEPSNGPHDNANPVGETWSEVHPGFGSQILITAWSDNGTGVVDPGDALTVVQDGGPPVGAAVDLVGTNITATPVPPVPTRPAGWGFIKSLIDVR